MNWIEISQPELTPIILSISTIQSITFRSKPNGGDDAVIISSTLWEKPLIIQSPRAERIYLQIKKLLKPKVLEC